MRTCWSFRLSVERPTEPDINWRLLGPLLLNALVVYTVVGIQA
jgi:hypothetical protein